MKQLSLFTDEKIELEGWLTYESYTDDKGMISYGLYLTWQDYDGSWMKTNLIDDIRTSIQPTREVFQNGFNLEQYGQYKITIERLD